MEFVEIGNKNDIQPGQVKTVEINGEKVALYNVDGEFFATTNTCKHVGGPLGQGTLDKDMIICPWHQWRYNVKTGIKDGDGSVKLPVHEVKIENDKIMVSSEPK